MDALPGEATCPICQEFFRDPVSIHCGHHFCRACIERCWEWPTGAFACPRCRDAAPERSLRPSRELARVLEIARRLSRGEALGLGPQDEEEEEEEEEEGCPRHREPLEVFCQEDAAALCAICRESRAHRAHTVLPLPEAARRYKEQIRARLQTLKEDRDKLLELREAEMRKIQGYLEEAEAERSRILSHSRALLLALDELSRLRLARLRRLERDIGGAHEETATGLTREISRLEARARELEEKCEQPARTFLQDLSGALDSPGHGALPPPLPELGARLRRFREENRPLEEALGRVRDLLEFELPEKMPVTLDPRTAHPQLRVAPDGTSVSWEPNRDPPEPGPEPGPEPIPGHEPGPGPEPGLELGTEPEPGPEPGLEPEPEPEPGAEPDPEPGPDPSVLGREGVTAGRRCWDVRVAPEGSWALGVALETPGSGEGTLGNGAGTTGNGAGTTGIGEGTPWNGEGTLGSGAGTPWNGAETLGSGAETTGIGAETTGNGAGTLGNGEGTPWSGEGTLGSGSETPGIGTGTPGTGAGIPGTETRTPGIGTGTPGIGSETLGIGTGTPGTGSETPGIGTGTPGTGSETPGIGTGTPGSGSETPGSPGWELWSMGLCQGQFWALTARERIPLFPALAPGTVRVALDYERGQVAFFDAGRRSLIFAFPAAAFGGRRARPWFLVWGEGSRLELCP